MDGFSTLHFFVLILDRQPECHHLPYLPVATNELPHTQTPLQYAVEWGQHFCHGKMHEKAFYKAMNVLMTAFAMYTHGLLTAKQWKLQLQIMSIGDHDTSNHLREFAIRPQPASVSRCTLLHATFGSTAWPFFNQKTKSALSINANKSRTTTMQRETMPLSLTVTTTHIALHNMLSTRSKYTFICLVGRCIKRNKNIRP